MTHKNTRGALLVAVTLGVTVLLTCAGGSSTGGGTGGATGGAIGATGGVSTTGGASGATGGTVGGGGGTGGQAGGGAIHGSGGAITSGTGGGAGGDPTGGQAGGQGSAGGQGGKTNSPACEPFTNTGCPAGQKCTSLQSGTTLSIGCGSKGTKKAGETCAQQLGDGGAMTVGDDCGDGLACFALTGETTPTCRQFCDGAHACPAMQSCMLRTTGGDATFCSPMTPCQPLAQTGCKSGQGCYADANGAQCANAGTKTPGEACAAANDCQPGTNCVSVGGGAPTCAAFCSTATGGTPACPSGKTCLALTGIAGEPNAGTCH